MQQTQRINNQDINIIWRIDEPSQDRNFELSATVSWNLNTARWVFLTHCWMQKLGIQYNTDLPNNHSQILSRRPESMTNIVISNGKINVLSLWREMSFIIILPKSKISSFWGIMTFQNTTHCLTLLTEWWPLKGHQYAQIVILFKPYEHIETDYSHCV